MNGKLSVLLLIHLKYQEAISDLGIGFESSYKLTPFKIIWTRRDMILITSFKELDMYATSIQVCGCPTAVDRQQRLTATLDLNGILNIKQHGVFYGPVPGNSIY